MIYSRLVRIKVHTFSPIILCNNFFRIFPLTWGLLWYLAQKSKRYCNLKQLVTDRVPGRISRKMGVNQVRCGSPLQNHQICQMFVKKWKKKNCTFKNPFSRHFQKPEKLGFRVPDPSLKPVWRWWYGNKFFFRVRLSKLKSLKFKWYNHIQHLVGICMYCFGSRLSPSIVAGNFMQEAQNDLSSNHGYLKYLFKRAFEKYDSEYLSMYLHSDVKVQKKCKNWPPFFSEVAQWNNSEYFYYIVMEQIPKSWIRVSSDSKRSDSDRIG